MIQKNSNETPLLEAKHIKMHFPIYRGIFKNIAGWVKAVEDVSFSVPKGSVLGLVGESGCGKSTLGRVCMNLLQPTSGEVYFEGNLITPPLSKDMRRQMQVVFQDPYSSLNPRKTILENIGESLEFHKLVSSKIEKEEKVVDLLEKVGLESSILYSYPHAFSGGQQQRICIARALALNPKFIVFDEAVSALDVSVQAQVLNLLKNLQAEFNLSYLFISHDLSVVRYICDYILVLYLGKVVEAAPTKELFNKPTHPYTQALLSAIPREHPNQEKKVHKIIGETPSPINMPKGCPFHTRCPYKQKRCLERFPEKVSLKNNHYHHCIL